VRNQQWTGQQESKESSELSEEMEELCLLIKEEAAEG